MNWSTIALLCVSLASCTGPSKKKPSTSSPPPNYNSGQTPFWNEGNPAAKSGSPTASVPGQGSGNVLVSGSDPEATGILAGRVVDQNLARALGTSYVRVEAAGESAGQSPVDAETTPDGHFYIRGLTPGRSYRLVARTKQDGRVIGGEVVARPPDARLLITLSADYVGSTPAGSDPPRQPERGASGVTPLSPSAELLTPRAGGNFYPPPAPENLAANNSANIPQANIPVPGLPETLPQRNWDPDRTNGPVPDCLVSNGRLLTLRLSDADGQVWDFSQRQGRLVLVDLWGTWCNPCLAAIPHLVQLQSTYRTRGLEVIGIACENGSNAENVSRVQKARRMFPTINYRILVAGESGSDPVRSQLRPTAFPGLFLLDSDGTIIWRGVGGNSIAELEPILRSRLGGY